MLLPIASLEVKLGVSYKKVVHEHRIYTDELEVTKPKIRTKRIHVIGQRIITIHLQEDGTIHWEEK